MTKPAAPSTMLKVKSLQSQPLCLQRGELACFTRFMSKLVMFPTQAQLDLILKSIGDLLGELEAREKQRGARTARSGKRRTTDT